MLSSINNKELLISRYLLRIASLFPVMTHDSGFMEAFGSLFVLLNVSRLQPLQIDFAASKRSLSLSALFCQTDRSPIDIYFQSSKARFVILHTYIYSGFECLFVQNSKGFNL